MLLVAVIIRHRGFHAQQTCDQREFRVGSEAVGQHTQSMTTLAALIKSLTLRGLLTGSSRVHFYNRSTRKMVINAIN